MDGGKDLFRFKRNLLSLGPLIVAAFSLPLALRAVPLNRVYGFRTAASLASPDAWYSSNFWAGIAGVAFGVAGALLIRATLRKGPLDLARALSAGAITVFAALAALAAGLLAS